ncbi:TMEM1 family protein-like protein [Massarina eburnea CBS 473.64]|uniref:TMEM1 family protein-like protein n=1 Tax=Massarina eburnea CBS 473.64 TaxID=1395130 RepID=A0A6A6S101_9PLEO|nr:TMEM1 family protein-like protein [Massarina eburnea CBS 473.64]
MNGAGNGAPAQGATEIAHKQKQSESTMMDGLSSSKVTVEYHDRSGLFPLVRDQLASRLPLKNLHWKSPNRPLRSIDSLHVDLVPSADSVHISGVTSPGLAPAAAGTPSPMSTEHIRGPSKERRHQIPGLRRTPYLKVYLLRCDDADTYKSTSRKQLREWVKTHTPPSQSSSSASTADNHDAFEWMIVHVVIPDTAAASQPRGSANATTGEKEKTTGMSRFTRGTTTILEKIKADFNSASKTAPDRVTQVRLTKESIPPHMLPVLAVTSPPITETPLEQDRAWNDIIVHFKTLILLSFDLRVSQYEEDIREKDSQRALPGWNFCTFFILKEGLARGFESVGLVEDALLGYDELSVGLDTIIRDESTEGGNASGGVLLDHTEDLFQQASDVLKQSQSGSRKEPQPHLYDEKPFNATKKDYRGLILSNNISILDFRTYIFARQMSLLLRLGNSHSAKSDFAAKRPNAGVIKRSMDDSGVGTKSGVAANESEDLLSLAELCSRALNFITFAGRLLRNDLTNGAKAHDMVFPDRLADNIVRSWTFAALEQVLRETATTSLPFTKLISSEGNRSSSKILPFGKEHKGAVAETKSLMHPSRSSSLSGERGRRPQSTFEPAYAQNAANSQVVFDHGQYQEKPLPGQGSGLPQPKTGQQELAGVRAQLLVIQRRVLEHVGKSLGWNIGWAAVLAILNPKEELSDVDLSDDRSSSEDDDEDEDEDEEDKEDKDEDEEEEGKEEEEEGEKETDEKDEKDEGGKEKKDEKETPAKATSNLSPTAGLSASAIVNAALSIDTFRQFYETLSDLIVKHYMAAGQAKSGESVLGDLAALRFELGDFAAAAMYFGRMASLFAETRWNTVETTMLKMYAQCLKKLNRKDEYLRTLLDLLAKSAASRKAIQAAHKYGSEAARANLPKDWLDDDKVDTTGDLADLVDYSQQLTYDLTVSMAKYFNDIVVEPYVRHFDDKDGFQLRLQFRHVLEDEIELDQTRVRLINATQVQGKDIWLESSEPIKVKKGMCKIWLGSNVNTTGSFIVDKISMQAKRILFVHEPFKKAEATTPLGIMTSISATSLKTAKKSRVHCFPRTESFQARLYLAHFIHIDKPRHIEIKCSSGWNEIKNIEIRLKAASAGLRIRTANASGDLHIIGKPSPGVMSIGAMSADTTATFRIPYETETIMQDLAIKLEIDYTTENGVFQFHDSFTIPVELPLDVNVHDHFKNAALYSKFNIKTASLVPLEVLNVSLEGSGDYEVIAPRLPKGSAHVFPKQPVAITYKITKKTGDGEQRRKSIVANSGSLALSVEYRCLDEDVLDRLRELFTKAVQNSQVHRLTRLLVSTFTDRVEHRVLPQQFEKVAMLEKVDLGSFDDMGWGDCIDSLPHIIRDDTRNWLQKWHQENRTILLPKNGESDSPLPNTAPPSPSPHRRMIITVMIPQTHILHTASMIFPSSSVSRGSVIAVVGQPLIARLRIKHTRRWASPTSLVSAANLTTPTEAMDFVYSLEAHADTWLIAGQRRAHFSVQEDEESTFEVLLVPLRVGAALLPSVDIRARVKSTEEKQKSGGSGGGDGGDGEDDQLNCETDYLGAAEVVMVVPDVRSSTVGVGEMGRVGSAMWLKAESR